MPALELTLLGTGSPMHTPHRFGPSQVIHSGETRLLIDTGWGSTSRLHQAGMPPRMIDAVFITHLHSDHTTDMADFLVMRWVGCINRPIPIYGPAGTKRMVHAFQEAMAADTGYRLAHHGDKLWPGASPPTSQSLRPAITRSRSRGMPISRSRRSRSIIARSNRRTASVSKLREGRSRSPETLTPALAF
jgi:ribonuclease BN (tRNA processing enzyme)